MWGCCLDEVVAGGLSICICDQVVLLLTDGVPELNRLQACMQKNTQGLEQIHQHV
jgi:hypothetical protein